MTYRGTTHTTQDCGVQDALTMRYCSCRIAAAKAVLCQDDMLHGGSLLPHFDCSEEDHVIIVDGESWRDHDAC